MSTALVVMVLVLLLPLFLASWRVSAVGLAGQGALMAWLAYDRDGVTTAADVIRLIDLGLVRALVVPVALYQVMAARRAAARNDVLAPNLISWTLALVAVLVGFRFAAHMPLPEAERPMIGVAATALLLAMLVLASTERVYSQVVGVFRFENALALFEMSRPEPDGDPAVRGAMLVVLVVTLGLARWYLRTLTPTGDARAEAPR